MSRGIRLYQALGRSDRKKYETPVLIGACSEQACIWSLTGITCNISTGGMSFTSASELTDATIVVRFISPDHTPIVRVGRIAWHKPAPDFGWQYGIQFRDPLPASTSPY